MKPRVSLLGVLLLAFIGAISSATEFTGKLVGVSDGDTISVLHDGKAEKVRLNGIDCPESGQPYGNRARQFVSDKAFGQLVRVAVFEKDKYGRTIADVYLPDGTMLNAELVKAGMAWWYRKYAPHDEVLAKLEAEARDAKRGLWADANPVAPWDWRLGTRAPTATTERASSAEVVKNPQTETLPDVWSRGSTKEEVRRIQGPPKTVEKYKDGEEHWSYSRLAWVTFDRDGRVDRWSNADSSLRVGSTATVPVESKVAPQASTPKPAPVQDVTVYVTRTGSCYHRRGCRYLSKSCIPMSLSEAKNRYTPCSVCSPPT